MELEKLKEMTVFDRARKSFRKDIGIYHKNFGSKNRLPKAKDWQPLRMCTRDMVLSLITLKKNVRDNTLIVRTCAINNIDLFEAHYSTMVTLSVILSEAFKRSTKMEIKFLSSVENGNVPMHICNYANKVGLRLRFAHKGVILPSEARLLFLSITEFSRRSREIIVNLHKENKVSLERVCYMVNGGIWKKDEMESILLSHPNPESLILGLYPAEVRLPFVVDCAHARLAILGGSLDRVLRKRILEEGVDESRLNDREIMIGFIPSHSTKFYESKEEDVHIPWDVYGGDGSSVISKGKFVFAKLFPFGQAELTLRILEEINVYANGIVSNIKYVSGIDKEESQFFFVVPADFKFLDQDLKERVFDLCNLHNIKILIFPYAMKFLDEQAFSKIDISRRLRR